MKVLAIVLISLLLIVGCTQQAPAPVQQEEQAVQEETEAILEETPLEEVEVIINLPEEIQALFDKAKEKTNSLHYMYRGPETDYEMFEYFMQGSLVRIVLGDEFKDIHLDKDAYNAIYMDLDKKVADGHCDAQTCIRKGKKRSISFNDYGYIKNPLDWIDEITEAEKIGEELIDNRKSWRLDTNVGEVYVDSFSGVVQRIIDGETEYSFIRIEVNGVKDEEVRPE